MHAYLAIVTRRLCRRLSRTLLCNLFRSLFCNLLRSLLRRPSSRLFRSLLRSLFRSLLSSQFLPLQSPLGSQAFSLGALLFTRGRLIKLGRLSNPFAFPDALWSRSSNSSGFSSGVSLTYASRGGLSHKGTCVFRGIFGRVFSSCFGSNLGCWHPVGPLPEGVGLVVC